MTYIVLSVYLLTLTSHIRHKINHTQVNLIHLKTFELELDFAEYSTLMCGLLIFAGPPVYHLPATVGFVYIYLQP